MLVQHRILASSIKHRRSVMTTTDSPTTTAGQVQSVTERSPRRHSEGTPTDRVDWWSPRITAVESVERYFRFVHRVLELNRELAMSWTGSVGSPSRVIREQAESGGRQFTPTQRPTIAECTTTRADTAPEVAGEPVTQARPTRTDRAQQPDGGVRTTGHGDQLTGRGRPATGLIDGLIGHLLDLDITGSHSTNHP
jgi:hypothetical protein